MKRDIITINENGTVNVPSNKIMMTDYEIAQLLGATVPMVRGAIKRFLKTRHVADCCGGVVSGRSLKPEYFGLDVVIAITFQVDSCEANLLRKWVMRRVVQQSQVPIYLQCGDNLGLPN